MTPLHQQLRGLVGQYGPQVLDDAAGLRAVLRDLSPSGGTEFAELDVVGQIVRCGAYAELKSRLAGGTPPRDAVDAAARLAVERTEPVDAAAAWRACAALGYALGAVPEKLVLEGPGGSRSQTLDSPDVSRLTLDSQREKAARSRWLSRTGLLAAAVVLALIGVGGVLLLVNQGEDPTEAADPGSVTTTDPGSEPTTDTTDPGSPEPPPPVRDTVSDLFSPLGAAITAWVPRDGCSDLGSANGQREYRCEIEGFNLRLRAHSGVDDLVEFRQSVLNTAPEQIISHKKSLSSGRGTFFLRRAGGSITLYWDNLLQRQSAYFRVPESVMSLEEVQQFYRSRRPPLGEPMPFEKPVMPSWDGTNRGMKCARIPTYSPGQLEYNRCTGKAYTVDYVKVDDLATLNATRVSFRDQASAFEQPWHYKTSPNVDRGTQIYYETPGGQSRLYWDHTEDLWWGLLQTPANKPKAIKKIWAR